MRISMFTRYFASVTLQKGELGIDAPPRIVLLLVVRYIKFIFTFSY